MNKKKILIVFTGPMDLGGVERSLIGLLDAIDYEKYRVDLFLYAHKGPLFKEINKNVHLLPECKELRFLRDSFKAKVRNKCYYSAWLRLLDAIKTLSGNYNHDESWNKILKKSVKKTTKYYDIAISFFMPFDYIKEMSNAKIKVGWIHTDYKSDNSNIEDLKKQYSGLDKIVAVSEEVRHSFSELLPIYEDKLITIENILSKDYVYKLSLQYKVNEFDQDYINLLSIGRFCWQKNFDSIPKICSELISLGLKVRWYIIGFGAEEQLIREQIKKYQMEDTVVILGKINNPYPYIRSCTVYVQPSRVEGKSVAVREAQMLGKAVIITDYPTAASQVINGYDGIIVPLENNCALNIYKFLINKELMKKIEYNCINSDFSNSGEIEKIYKMIEGDKNE